MTINAMIKDARALVARGWTQCGGFSDLDGNFCAMGAVIRVADMNPGLADFHMPVFRLFNTMVQQLGYGSIYLFNDDPSTTHQDVLDFFDKALVELGAG